MKYNVVVIGGGPAGMMAAGRAGEMGASTILLEKNKFLGLKLLITGKGRCNITNRTDEPREMIKRYGPNGNFLHSSFYKFGVQEIIDFLESKGLKTKVERGKRVFPKTNKAQDVLLVLKNYLDENNVKVRKESEIIEIVTESGILKEVLLKDGKIIQGDLFIFATGGKSYPMTGSDGSVHKLLKKIGHTIIPLRPSLSPLNLKNEFIEKLEGLSLKNVEASIFKNGKKVDSRFGEAVFTHNGISGPIMLDVSKKIGGLLPSKVTLSLDFKPALSFRELDIRIQNDFKEQNNRQFRNSLDKLLPQKLIPVIISLSKINPNKKVNLITGQERKKLLHLLKEFELEVKNLVGFKKAVVTAGGVALSEVNPKTLQSKKFKNLYFAGELLDLDGPTGGYNLQVAWSTGYTAGESASLHKQKK